MGKHFRNTGGAEDGGPQGTRAAGIAASVWIATRRGFVAAGDLAAGEAILTRDNGYRPIRRIEPMGFLPCALLRGTAIWLCPGHGVLHRISADAEEGLVPARTLSVAPTSHLSRHFALALHLDRHEILLAEGAWIESQPGTGTAARPRIFEIARGSKMRRIRVADGGVEA